MRHKSTKKFLVTALAILAFSAPSLVMADGGDDGDDDRPLLNAICIQLLDALGVDTDRSNICPLTQGQ